MYPPILPGPDKYNAAKTKSQMPVKHRKTKEGTASDKTRKRVDFGLPDNWISKNVQDEKAARRS
jgi:hypothetical protein